MNKNIFELLVEIRNLGYEIITYEKARTKLKIEPLYYSKFFIIYKYYFKNYFIFNKKVYLNELESYLNEFLKNYIQKNNIFENKIRRAL